MPELNLDSSRSCRHSCNNHIALNSTFTPRPELNTQYHMLPSPSSNPLKRKLRDQESLQRSDTYYNTSKRQKRAFSARSAPPTAFWDNLSQVHLTRTALQELDRRYSAQSTRFRRSAARKHCLDKDLLASRLVRHYTERCDASFVKDLQRFARQGGPDMSEAHGYPAPAGSLRGRNSRGTNSEVLRQHPTPTPSDRLSAATSSSRNSGPYNRNFQQHLIDHNILPDEYEYPDGRAPSLPENWEEINRRLNVPRGSLSPSQFTSEDFKKFKKANAHAFKEKQVTSSVLPLIEGSIKNLRCTAGGIPFRNLDPLTDNTIAPGNPDIFYGARPEQLDPRIREELQGLIVPSTQSDLPIVPNFFVAAKGPDGTAAVAERQASYDGALGARGIHSLQVYGQTQTISSAQASTISTIYHGGTLKLYTVHRTEPIGSSNRPAYSMHQIRSFAMTDSLDTFRQGATVYRNARDWAEQQRNKAIDEANRSIPTPLNESTTSYTPIATVRVDNNDFRSPIENESPKSESLTYTTPPTERNSDISRRLSTTPPMENPSISHANKRTRRQTQGSSPVPQPKRNRAHSRHRSALPIVEDTSISTSTGVSFQLEDHRLQQEGDESDGRTELLSSDGE